MGNSSSEPFRRVSEFHANRKSIVETLVPNSTTSVSSEQIDSAIENISLFEKSNALLLFSKDKFVLDNNDLRRYRHGILNNPKIKGRLVMVCVKFRDNTNLHFEKGTYWSPQKQVIQYYTFDTEYVDMALFLQSVTNEIVSLKSGVSWKNVLECIETIKFVTGAVDSDC